MDLQLLGPLHAFEDGRAVEIGRGRESALLALLAIRANQPVAADKIVDELWGERSPENATKSVQIYVSRLRKAIGAERIQTTGGGYLLRLEPEELDVVRFERLAARGREQLAQGNHGAAERTLTKALDIWRGEALADFRFAAFAQDEIRRLDDARASTVSDRVDAQLAAGHEDRAIPALRELIASQPLWERPRYQLMLALYRSGRQAEALDVYRQTRTVLDRELGLEPGPELQQLERRILNQDPELGAPKGPVAPSVRSKRAALLVVAGGALIVAAAAAAVAVLATGHGAPRALRSISPNSLAAIDPSTNRLVAQVALGSSPTAVGVGTNTVWVADANRQRLLAVDPRRLKVRRTVPLASIPTDLVVGRSAVWTTNPLGPEAGTLTRVDERGGQTHDVTVRSGYVADLFAPSTPNAVALDDSGGVWTNTLHGRLVRVRDGRRRVYDIGRGRSIDGIAFGAGSIWVASSVDDKVLRVDPESGHVTQVLDVAGRRGPAGPAAVAWGDGSIWVADALSDRVTRIDPGRSAVVTSVAVGPRPTAIAVGAGGVWALNAGDGSVSRIDPAANRLVATVPVARVVTGLAAGADRVWVTVAGGNAPQSAPPSTPARPLVTGSCSPMESGGRSPDVVIVSDLPTFDNGGRVNATIRDMRSAISSMLRRRNYRAGSFRVGYQACTDSSPGASPDPPLCASNARAFAADPSVVGVIGSYQSICSGIELPILNTGATGPVAMISPSNTYVGLTHEGPQTGPDEPDRYFPTGVRNYVRLTAPDDGQGAALAELARRLKRRHLFLLDDGDPTSAAMVAYVSRAARRLGVGLAGTGHWSAKGPYHVLAGRIRAARADAVVLTGCICTNGGELVTDLRRGLGPDVPFLASDNFTCSCDMASPDAPKEGLGMYISGAGAAPAALPSAGRRFVRSVFTTRPFADLSVYVPTVAAATNALLQAIGRSDGTRASVVERLTHDRVSGTPIGNVLFDANGDPARSIFTIFRVSAKAPAAPHVATEGLVFDRLIDADPGLSAP